MHRSQQMDNGGNSPAVAIGVLVGLVAAVAAFTLVITGGVYSGEFVDLLPAIGFVFLILAAFLLIRGGGG